MTTNKDRYSACAPQKNTAGWAVFDHEEKRLVGSNMAEQDARIIADLLNSSAPDAPDIHARYGQLLEEAEKLRGYLDNVRTGRQEAIAPGLERTLLIGLLRRARNHLPGTPGDPSVLTNEMFDPEEVGSIDASKAQLALDIEHAFELLDIDP